MERKIIENLQNLKEITKNLESFSDKKYIFRGQPNAKDELKPNAFRPSSLKKHSDDFPVKEEEILKWTANNRITQNIELWTRGYHINYPPIKNFIAWLIKLMQFNYALYIFLKYNPHAISSDDKVLIDLRNENFWTAENTFFWLFENLYPRLLTRFNLDGSILQTANPEEDLTGMDQTFAQHYSIATAALDWSKNPFIALYFSLGNHTEEMQQEKSIICDIFPKYFSIYLYKQLHEENAPVIIKDRNTFIHNPRAIAQEGTFTYFTKPCSFYIQKGTFPSIDDYDFEIRSGKIDESFDLKVYTIRNTEENVNFLKEELVKRNINKTTLLLDAEYSPGPINPSIITNCETIS